MLIELQIGPYAGRTVDMPHAEAVAMLHTGRALPKCDIAYRYVPKSEKRKRGRPRKDPVA